MRRAVVSLFAVLVTALLLAPSAVADQLDAGEGLYGETNDKVVTNFFFGVIAFFPLLILALSVLQWRLDKRKDARKAAAKARRGRSEWHGGW